MDEKLLRVTEMLSIVRQLMIGVEFTIEPKFPLKLIDDTKQVDQQNSGRNCFKNVVT